MARKILEARKFAQFQDCRLLASHSFETENVLAQTSLQDIHFRSSLIFLAAGAPTVSKRLETVSQEDPWMES